MRVLRWAGPVAFAVIAVVAVGCAASEANGDSGGSSGDAVVAKIGDEVITAAELETELRKQDAKSWQVWYDARKRVLDAMVTKRVLDAEIAKRGTTVDGLQAEVAKDVAPVTDAEIQAFYEQNKARMGGRALDEMRENIQKHLAGLRSAQVMQTYMGELKKQAGVRILLDPPRSEVKIAANDPRKGPEGAPITLVEFSDFQ